MMWKKYKQRVLLAMSSQAFAQLVILFVPVFILWLINVIEWDQRHLILRSYVVLPFVFASTYTFQLVCSNQPDG